MTPPSQPGADPALSSGMTRRAGSGDILSVVLVYAAFSGLWILLSDWTVEWLLGDIKQVILVSTIKGFAFVLISSLLLYWLMRRQIGAAPSAPPRPILPFALLAAAILVLTMGAISHVFKLQREMGAARFHAGASLEAIWVGLTGLLAILMAAVGFYVLHQRQQLALAASVQQSQAERLRALRLLAAIADSSDDAIFAKDLDGRYILFNPAASRFVGKPVDEVLGADDRALFPPEQAAYLMDFDRRVIAENRIITHEEMLELPDGERYFLATKGPLRDSRDTVIGSFGISRDITPRKQTEEAQRALLSDLAATLRAIPDLLFEADVNGRYLKVNAARSDLLAAPESQLLGQTVRDVLPAAAAETALAALAAANVSGSDYGRIIELPLADGAHWFELSVARKETVPGSEVSGAAAPHFIVLSRDVTARVEAEAALTRQAEELLSRNSELERFNRASVGRELDMIALKQQVNALAKEIGREPPYDLAFLDAPAAAARPGEAQ